MRTLNQRVAGALAWAQGAAIEAGAASGTCVTSEGKVDGAFQGGMVGALVSGLTGSSGNPARLDDLGLQELEVPTRA